MNATHRPDGHRLGSPAYRRMLAAMVCAGVATFAQVYSPQGVLQLIAADQGISADRAALTVSAATAGMALAVIPWSFVGDRLGRRRAMFLAVGGATVLAVATAWIPVFEVMLLVRLLEGAALGGVAALAMAYVSEEVDPEARVVAAGWYVAGTTVGGLLGRLLATPVAAALGWRAGMTAVVVLAVVAAIGFMLLAPAERRFVPTGAGTAPSAAVRRLAVPMRDPGQLVLLVCAFLLTGGFVAVYNYVAFHLTAPPYLVPTALLGMVFLTYLGGTAAAPLVGAAAARRGRLPMMLGSIGVLVAGLLITLSGPLPLVVLGLVVMAAGFFGAHSLASGWAGARAEDARAQATGLYNFAYYLGSSVIGWSMGFVYERWGWTALIVAVITCAVIPGLLAAGVLRERPQR